MNYCQNINDLKNDTFKMEPIKWGDLKIIGLQENYPKDSPFADFYRLQNENWYKLIKGILTNNIDLVKENIDKVSILNAVPVITDDTNDEVKLFDVKEAKKYSNDEIINYLRNKYNEKSLNTTWFNQGETKTSRGSYFSTVPSFDGTQLAIVKTGQFKPLENPITFGETRIIGIPNNYIPSSDFEDNTNLDLLRAVLSGNLDTVKKVTESYSNSISTIQTVITENFNELHLDLVSEAKNLGFDNIAQHLEMIEKEQGKSFGLSFGKWLKSQKK